MHSRVQWHGVAETLLRFKTLCQHQEKIFRQHFIPEDVYFIFRRYFTKEFSLLYISVPKDEWYSTHANLLQTERSKSDYRERYNGIFIKVCPTLLGLYNCAHANGDSEGIEANITHYVVSSCAYRQGSAKKRTIATYCREGAKYLRRWCSDTVNSVDAECIFIISAKEVMFSSLFVCLTVGNFAQKLPNGFA